jgi:hypothetical protein
MGITISKEITTIFIVSKIKTKKLLIAKIQLSAFFRTALFYYNFTKDASLTHNNKNFLFISFNFN